MADDSIHIGIDVGTSAVRAIAINASGQRLAMRQTPLPSTGIQDQAGASPHSWWQTLTTTLQALTADIDSLRVRAIAVDATSSTLLLANSAGEPLGPALMYNDARAIEESHMIARVAPADCAAHGPGASLAKALWLLRHIGQTPATEPHYLLHQADWLSGRLTNDYGHSDENNALKLGYDVVNRQWPDWLAELSAEIMPLLPTVQRPGTPTGSLSPDVAKILGLPAETLIMAGTTDSVASFMAATANAPTAPGDAVSSLGSTLVLKLISEKPVFAPEYGIYSHRLGDQWLAGGASNSGGNVLAHCFSNEQLAAMTPHLHPATPTPLQYYPLVQAGERFPINDPTLAPRLSPRPDSDVEFFQGILEGIAAIEARGYELLQDLGAPALRSVRSTGGGAGNRAWQAIRQQRLGVPVIAATDEDAAYGSALLARQGDL
ncbi:MAG: FGGY-family carbohydrate kinase [Gammaproteobacteria bacterium]|nr:MAG: FGGY-family carbohydrate kinase [Gammaproteobacteria bacterium]